MGLRVREGRKKGARARRGAATARFKHAYLKGPSSRDSAPPGGGASAIAGGRGAETNKTRRK